MHKKIVSFDKLFCLESLPPAPFDGLELTPESYYESPVFFAYIAETSSFLMIWLLWTLPL